MVQAPPINTPTYLRLRIQIREDIMSGQWALGSHLTLRGLGAHYRVSNVPVREALLQLQGDGLVEMRMNLGATVTVVDESWLRDFLSVRDALEAMLTRNACERHRVEQLALLGRHQRTLAKAVEEQDWESMFAAERQFTSRLYETGGNAHAAGVLEPRNCLLEAFRRSRPPLAPVDPPRWAERLHLLCDAISRSDTDTACSQVAQHLAALRLHLTRLLRSPERAASRRHRAEA
ncbi:GntR family transcriptional regulator [Roseateles sp. SL47]|jgi:DNA-binding GntR family transcriptional regulator|uniref:GntR family transcriptional regulator n=1 Tax=Roseateles sp. SL47 TaxID=2995138 RepID=UPI00226DD7F6|nr:GntR family transcriptional regulator [Roseateles sp. SL47]WAC74125.1 GntR family transcriptional regulator [Roseateles sp. SL47]